MTAMEDVDESEWEYEYASDDFEDVYVTLALPIEKQQAKTKSNTSIFQIYVPPQKGNKRKKKVRTGPLRRRRRDPETGELLPLAPITGFEQDDNPEDSSAEEEEDGRENDAATRRSVQAVINGFGKHEYNVRSNNQIEENSIQIVDLHTKNPLISYQGTIYSCSWSTSMGTDMLFSKQNRGDESESSKVLRSFKDWDLLSLSSTRLIATELKQKNRVPETSIAPDDNPQAAFLHRFPKIKQATYIHMC